MNPNEFLAKELTGWNLSNAEMGWYDEYDRFICFKSKWNPLENIAQAFNVVEKMGEKDFCFELCKNIKGEYLAMFSTNMVDYTHSHKNPATAITLAACKALKGE